MATRESDFTTQSGKLRTHLRDHEALLFRVLAIALFLVAWEAYTMTQPAYLFPGIGRIYEAFLRQIAEFGLIDAYLRTMGTVFVGYVLGVVVGVLIGLSMGLDARVEVMLDPYVSAMYVAPISALIPFIIIVGGATLESRVFVVFLFVVFDMIINTMNGTKTVPDRLIQSGRSFGGGRRAIIQKIIVPHTVPYMFTGMRLGIGRAIKGVILAELLIEFSNLGAIIMEWQNMFQIAGILSVTVLLMITGMVLTRSVGLIRRWIIVWETEKGDDE